MEAQPTDNPTLRALVQRLAESDCCWFSSVRPDGRAHSVPIWHVWHLGRVYIITDPKSVKVVNIQHHPATKQQVLLLCLKDIKFALDISR